MANTINVSAALSLSASGASPSASWNFSAIQAGAKFIENLQNIGLVAETITIGDIGTLGYIFIKNTDPTNYVELALDNGMTQKFAKLRPGECCVLPASVSVIYAKANTAACDCLVVAAEL